MSLMRMVLVMQTNGRRQHLELVYNEVPMRLVPVEYPPDDYKGPNAGSENEIVGNSVPTHNQSTVRSPRHRIVIIVYSFIVLLFQSEYAAHALHTLI